MLIFFYSGLDNMTSSRRHSGFFRAVRLDEMIGCLEDLIVYFAQPPEDEELSKYWCDIMYYVLKKNGTAKFLSNVILCNIPCHFRPWRSPKVLESSSQPTGLVSRGGHTESDFRCYWQNECCFKCGNSVRIGRRGVWSTVGWSLQLSLPTSWYN